MRGRLLSGMFRTVVIVVASALLWSCSAKSPSPKPSMPVYDSGGRVTGSGTVQEGIKKEIVPPEPGKGVTPAPKMLERGEPIWIRSGKSRVLHLQMAVKRVSIGNPELAGLVVLGPRTIMVNAKEVPGAPEAAQPRSTGVITGRTLTPPPHFAETTLIVWDGGEAPDVHSLFIADFLNQQVLLEVTVAELDRSAMEEHGIDFRNMANSFVSAYFLGGGAGPAAAGASSLVPPQGNQGLLPIGTNATKPVYAFHLPKDDITAFIQILQTEGLATILAQPKLLAMSGQNAVFQVGGEIPIRIATGFATDVQFKPFGTIVNFIPSISDEGDIILTVTPEVSEPDFTSPVEGIPSFRTRRASTSTRLRNGETLIIGGLLQNIRREQVAGIPYLQDIPVVGYVFRNTTYFNDLTELVVVVTPHIVQAMAPGEELTLPTDRGPLTNEDIRTKADPAEATRPRIPALP